MLKLKRIISLVLAILLLSCGISAQAKTSESAKGENIFFYARNAEGKDILLKIVPLDDLKKLSHGQLSEVTTGTDTGVNYYISTTDNYPTTQYCEAVGITIPELVEYVKSVTTVKGASSVTFTGDDTIRLMATDSFGNYNRAWSYDELYGTERYYFEGLYDAEIGWISGWEIAGEDNSKFGITLEEYYDKYKDRDRYFDNKRAVFDTGVLTVPILATESYSGRTNTASLVNSTEIGIADFIEANEGIVTGCLENALEDTWSLRLSLPMTESDLMGARRTAFDNFKWIYNLRLDMENAPALASLGTVAQPQANASLSADGNTLTMTVTCDTAGASIYYSTDGSPQIPYTAPVKIDVAGRDLAADPVTFYMTAVKEGWDDAGIITVKYPGLPPAFETIYSGIIGESLTFTAASSVTAADWSDWTGAIGGIALKTPTVNGYLTLDKAKYKIDNAAKTITFDKSLFDEPGSYSFVFRAAKYSNKNVSLSMKKAAPAITAAERYDMNADIVLTFDDTGYHSGLSVYVTPPGGAAALISTTYLDRTVLGKLTILASYYDSPSCMITQPGVYTLELRNASYAPGEQTVKVTIGDTEGFTDVPLDAWYAEAVAYVAEAGYFGGTGGGEFSPELSMTRAMFVTVLSRIEGINADKYTYSSFSDVPAGQWYSAPVEWASDNGIVTGVGGKLFDPDRQITREEMAVILYRYAQLAKRDVSAVGTLDAFPDAAAVSDWARDALGWAVDAGLINGIDGKLAPQGTATRAQVAAVIMRYSLLMS